MADDQKLEVLEEEIKVLKGEVRRTLVDLRALVMRADSPLNDSSIGRRAAMAEPAPEEAVPATRKEPAETVPPPPVAQPIPEAVENPAPGPGPGPGFAAPGPPAVMPPGTPPGMPMQAPPMWPAAPVYQPPPPPPPPAPPPSPAPPPGAPDSGAAEQMLRMADQERRMAEQDRKLAEQERKMADAERSKSNDKQQSNDKQSEQEERIAKLELNLADADRSKSNGKQQSGDKQSEQEERIAKLELNLAEARRPPDLGLPPGPGRMPVKKDDSVAAAVKAEETEEEKEQEQEFTGSREATNSSAQDPGDAEGDTFEDHAEVDIHGAVSINGRAGGYEAPENELEETLKAVKTEVRYVESRVPVQQIRQAPQREDEPPETKIGSQFDHVEEEYEPRGNNGRGNPVFDEYFELMEIAEGPELPGLVPAGEPLDLNLVASLVRWASIAKHRVGEERLSGILELYFQSRPISTSLKDLLNQITEMVDAFPGDEEQTAQVCVDLISHLHGILTGGLPVGQVSQVVQPPKG